MSGLLFRNPVFGFFWTARIVSYLGSEISKISLVLYVAGVTDSGIAVSILLLSDTLPRLLGPFTGAVVDRVEGRRLMVFCDLGQAAFLGAMAFLLPPLPVLVTLVAGASILSTLFFPAGRSAVPSLVPDEDLTSANALVSSAANLAFAAGPALGALIFTVTGARGALTLDALTFVLSAALMLRLPALPPSASAQGRPAGNIYRETRDGLIYVIRHRIVGAAVLGLLMGVTFVGVNLVALVFLARDSLGAGDVGYGVMASAHGIGMILGPLLLLRWGGRLAPSSIILLGLALEGVTTLFTGLVPALALAIAFYTLAGVGVGVENVAMDALIQKVVPRAMLGRVFGIFYSGVMLAEGLAQAMGGPLLELTSPRAVFVIGGCGGLAATLLLWRLLPHTPGTDGTGEGSLRSRESGGRE